ncbi:hypothetical protein B0T10DRAFT_562552 [Thelonectria olida]|uniref:Uncharacterized protein n=1 Tax=Thelonectria olida TaxID=1576542 RepID=A0A9P8W357_9HYPO|nr:hypothetical protein B0T10DRAFT_562552 [Thelonectria olida]
MHTDRSNTYRLQMPSRCLWVYFLGLMAFEPTLAKHIIIHQQPYDAGKSKSVDLGANLKNISRGTTNFHVARDRFNPGDPSDTGAIVGGTIAAGIILGCALFVYFKIYKECVLRRRVLAKQERQRQQQLQRARAEQVSTSTPTNLEESEKNSKNMFPGFRASFDAYGQLLGRWSPRKHDDSASETSGLEFGDLSATAPMGETEPIAGPHVPPKAAMTLGIESNVPSPRHLTSHRPLSDRPRTPALPASFRFEEFYPSTPSLRNSSCSMSTLGRDLYQDTMQPPAPLRYAPPPLLERALPPEPLSPTPFNSNDNNTQRSSKPRYFVPMFGTGGRLQTPTSPGSIASSFQRDRYNGTRCSMGSNVI